MWIEKTTTKNGEVRYIFRERFTIPNTGTQKVISVTLPSQNRHAKKVAPELLQEKFQKQVLAPMEKRLQRIQKLTLWAVLDEWVEYMAPTVKIGTSINHQKYTGIVKSYISDTLLFRDFTPVMAEKIVRDRYYVKLYSYSYCRAILTTIQRVMKFAKKAGYIENIEDFTELELKKRPATPQELQKLTNKFLNHDELASCLHQLDKISHRIALAMEFTALTGLRIGELLALRVKDYDKANNCINVNGTIVNSAKNGEDIQRGTPKNIYSYRDVYLNDRAKWIIEWFIFDNRRMLLWSKGLYKDRGYIFTTNRGFPYNQQYINQRLKLVHIEGKHITSHIFRHTHISMLAEKGVQLKAIMQRVGHNDPNTTLSIYTHVTSAMDKDSRQKIDTLRAI